MHAPPPVFGKRNASRPTARATAATATTAAALHAPSIDERAAAVFAEARRELALEQPERVVPRSFRAALLAGLVVGCALAGLDATRADATLHAIAGASDAQTAPFLPILILVALFGGARAAATILIVAHSLLRRLGATSHIAYAAAGGAVAAAFAVAALAVTQAGLVDASLLPGHGLAIDTAAGAGAGFVYRVFAGTQRA